MVRKQRLNVLVGRLLLACVLTTLVACDDEHAADCPAAEPAIESISLMPDLVAPGGDIAVVVDVRNFELSGEGGPHTEGLGPAPQDANPADADTCPGGHVHVYLDDLMTNPLIQSVTSEFTITIPADTQPGSHTLIGRLQNRDHSILVPEIFHVVDVTVQ